MNPANSSAAEMNPAAWRSFFEGSQLLRTSLERDLRRHVEMSHSDYNILLLLFEAEDVLCMGDIAQRLVFAPSRLTYAVKSLAERGFVVQAKDPNDRRRQMVQLTPLGSSTFLKARHSQRAALQHRLLEVISDEEFLNLADIFARVRTRINEIEGVVSDDPDCIEAQSSADRSAGEQA